MLPVLVGHRGVVASEDGHRRVLVDRMRLVARADGSIDRAAELLPGGNVASVALPSRLGGGYLFHVNAGGGTEIWRAQTWLGKLQPLARRGEVVTDVVPGFDRLYVRLSTGNRVIALDPATGAQMGLGALPVAPSYGLLAFADGWRAVVDTDLRGPLATFDAGATWRPVGIAERAQGVGVVSGNPAVLVANGKYLIDARGGLTFRADSREKGAPSDENEHAARPPGPLGKHPLRAAVEDGWPDSKETAIVARGGALARVSLRDGAVMAIAEEAYPERHAGCHAVRIGLHQVGFVCGEPTGPTVVYQHAPPLAMTPVLRFAKPRFVSASGNGALVIRGPCNDEPASESDGDARSYCVRSPAGQLRDIRVKGDLGVERVVGLGDGRIVVLVPPRGGSAGTLTVISGASAANATLALPAEPKSVARELKRGMWLDGFEERAPGVLGGWVEAGGPVVGVEVTLDGQVKAGELRDDTSGPTGGTIFGGRFAVSILEGGRAAETSDGGKTWTAFDLPERDEEARALPSRACGPVGCALPGWVRVGWGDPATSDDLRPAESPAGAYVPLKVQTPLSFRCEVASTTTPPLPDKPGPAPAPRTHGGRPGPARPGGLLPRETPNGWLPFRNTAPPALVDGELGLDNGAAYETILLRAYAWGKKGGDWTRTGRWLIRFDDRFDAARAGGVRSTALTASLWPDETSAGESVLHGAHGSVAWHGYLDPSGRSLLAASCRGSACALYSAVDGQPALPIRDASGRGAAFLAPLANGAVHVGETWFFLAQTPSYDGVALYRVDLGVARQIGTYHRSQRYSSEAPRVVRRALGGGVGLLIGGAAEPGERSGSWYVLPANPETGELGEAIALGRRDLTHAAASLGRCAPGQDGWLIDMKPDLPDTIVDVEGARAAVESVELRLRMAPGSVCLEAMAGRSGPFYASERAPAGKTAVAPQRVLTAPPGRKGSDDAATVPLAATEKSTGRRWGLSCKLNPRR
jgi:hypothetical protein